MLVNPIVRPTFLRRFVRFSGALASFACALASAHAYQPGDILITRYDQGAVQRYDASGTLLNTYTGTGIDWAGVALTADGGFVITRQSPQGGNFFDSTGTQTGTLGVGSFNLLDISVFGNGNLALNDQASKVYILDSTASTFVATVSTPGVTVLLGSTVGSDGLLYVAGSGSGNIGRIDQVGDFLGAISLSFNPADLVMNPLDGTLWVSDLNNDTIHHITTTGTELGSFSTGLGTNNNYGIALAPDDQSLYASGFSSSVIRHLSLTGTVLNDIPITNPGNQSFLVVVPTPEPTSMLLLSAGGICALLLRRRRR
jgi:hypothetical protein